MRNVVDLAGDVDVLILAVSSARTTELDPCLIEREIRRLPGVRHVLMNASAEVVVVEYLPAQLDASYVVATVLGTGCQVEPWFGW